MARPPAASRGNCPGFPRGGHGGRRSAGPDDRPGRHRPRRRFPRPGRARRTTAPPRSRAGVQLGDYRSLDDLLAFAAGCDVVTFDHEHVPGEHLAALGETASGPAGCGRAALTQDKLVMRERLAGLGVACPRFAPVARLAEVDAFAGGAWPVVLKAVSGGYDGRGVWVCDPRRRPRQVLEPRRSTLIGRGARRLRARAGRARRPLPAPAGRRVPGGARPCSGTASAAR